MATLGGFRDFRVSQLAYKLAIQIFNETKNFPHDERYSMIHRQRIRVEPRFIPDLSCLLLTADCLLTENC
jgi:hypothetical protein